MFEIGDTVRYRKTTIGGSSQSLTNYKTYSCLYLKDGIYPGSSHLYSLDYKITNTFMHNSILYYGSTLLTERIYDICEI